MRVLIAAAAVNSIVMTMPGTVVGLLAARLTGSATRAGISQAVIVWGGVFAALPLAAVAGRRGRRPAIGVGYLVGAVGSTIVVIAAMMHSYPLMLLGGLGIGSAGSAGLQARFAATDASDVENAGRAVGVLTRVSTIGAIVGPSMAGVAQRLTFGGRMPAFSAPFAVVAVGLVATGCFVLCALPATVPAPAVRRTPLRVLLRDGGIRHAVIGLVAAHAVMVTLMNMAVLHMDDGGATLPVIGIVVSLHTAAMFLPATIVGRLADRYGAKRVMVGGLLVQLAAAVVLILAGPADMGMISAGLTLLGVGWSGGFVAGSALLAKSAPPTHRVRTQGTADFLLQLTAACGALAAGSIVARVGYSGLACVAGFGLVIALAALLPRPGL